jgi:hypothetical protein
VRKFPEQKALYYKPLVGVLILKTLAASLTILSMRWLAKHWRKQMFRCWHQNLARVGLAAKAAKLLWMSQNKIKNQNIFNILPLLIIDWR